jgi:putative ABC transport system permease protein
VSWLGPARNLALSELERAGSQIATTSAGALAVLIASASLAAWREEVNVAGPGQGPLRSRWLQLGTLAAIGAGVAAFMARDRIDATDMEDPLLTLVPIAMILAGGVAAATIVLAGLPRLARRLRYSAPPMYLAVKRLSGASGMTRLLVVAGAWALGVAVYGFTMSSSVDLTTTAKAKLFIGSDFSALVGGDRTLPDVPQPVTHVVKVERAPMTGGGDVGLMGVDPETFAGVAFWDPAFSDRSLDDLVAELEEGKALSTADLGPSPSLARSDRQERFEVAEVVDAFPGMLQERPTVIMSQERLDEVLRTIGGTTSSRAEELWGKGDGAAIENALREQGFYFDRPLTAELVLDTPGLTSLLWMLGLLAALGAAASLIAIAGLLLYLLARQRTALVSSALTRRMGLSGPGEFSSWLGEIAGALLTSFLAGIAVGLPVANLMSSRLDPRPNLMPPPLLVIPAGMLIGLGAVLIVVSLLMSWRVKRIADRADIAEVMRT